MDKLCELERVMSEMESIAYNRQRGRDAIAVSCDWPALEWQRLRIRKEEIMGREEAAQIGRDVLKKNEARARES